MTRAQILTARWSLIGRKGRASTRVESGCNMTLVRLRLMVFIG